MKKQNIFLLLTCVLIAVAAFFLAPKDAEFGGSDGGAEVAITEVNPDYEPWFASIYEPASGEIES
ncbi:TPA: cobalt transport protein CbiN, partial [Streptococcus suis]